MNQFAVIGFENFGIECIIGTMPSERLNKQYIYIDLQVEAEVSKALQSDDIQGTIDYVSLAELCRVVAVKGEFYLLEKYANEVLSKITALFPVKKVWIKVKKTSAISQAACAFVEMSYTNT
jgi:dihydroneopterin aldolase